LSVHNDAARKLPGMSRQPSRPAAGGRSAFRKAWDAVRARQAVLIPVVSVGLALGAWQVCAPLLGQPIFFPSFWTVAVRGYQLFDGGGMLTDIGVSVVRILAGFAVGTILGAPIGLAMGAFTTVRRWLDPYVQFLRFIPAIAWLTPAVIWFGIGDTSKIVIIAYATVFIVVVNTAVGAASVESDQILAARMLGASKRQVFYHVTVPATVPYLLTGMRLGMGNAFATVISAEFVAANTGLGYLIWNSRIFEDTAAVFAGILVLGFLGLLADWSLRVAIRRFAGQYRVAT
jgi:ABC-type nitrate/sulfonate/bicarbonate transport system permease component